MLVLFSPLVRYQLIRNPKEGLLIRLSNPQTEKSPLSSSGKQLRNFSPLKAYFQCYNFLWLFCICETSQVKLLIRSFSSAYIKPCTRFSYYRGFTNGLQRPMNLLNVEAYAIFFLEDGTKTFHRFPKSFVIKMFYWDTQTRRGNCNRAKLPTFAFYV